MTVSSVYDEIQSMENQTTWNTSNSGTQTTTETSDKDMFLNLMLQQMKNQDPTQPMENQEWLSQLAQYSSLEQMTQMNEGLQALADSLDALSSGVAQNSGVSQTLSLIGKEVDIIADPEKPDEIITGTVTEATFVNGEGQIKVNGKYYSIGYVQNVREPGTASDDTVTQLPADGTGEAAGDDDTAKEENNTTSNT